MITDAAAAVLTAYINQALAVLDSNNLDGTLNIELNKHNTEATSGTTSIAKSNYLTVGVAVIPTPAYMSQCTTVMDRFEVRLKAGTGATVRQGVRNVPLDPGMSQVDKALAAGVKLMPIRTPPAVPACITIDVQFVGDLLAFVDDFTMYSCDIRVHMTFDRYVPCPGNGCTNPGCDSVHNIDFTTRRFNYSIVRYNSLTIKPAAVEPPAVVF